PFWAAWYRTVAPSGSFMFGLAPFERRSCTMSGCPNVDAAISAVQPSLGAASIDTPLSRYCLTTAYWPRIAASVRTWAILSLSCHLVGFEACPRPGFSMRSAKDNERSMTLILLMADGFLTANCRDRVETSRRGQ